MQIFRCTQFVNVVVLFLVLRLCIPKSFSVSGNRSCIFAIVIRFYYHLSLIRMKKMHLCLMYYNLLAGGCGDKGDKGQCRWNSIAAGLASSSLSNTAFRLRFK